MALNVLEFNSLRANHEFTAGAIRHTLDENQHFRVQTHPLVWQVFLAATERTILIVLLPHFCVVVVDGCRELLRPVFDRGAFDTTAGVGFGFFLLSRCARGLFRGLFALPTVPSQLHRL
jgi:hypothetical protein